MTINDVALVTYIIHPTTAQQNEDDLALIEMDGEGGVVVEGAPVAGAEGGVDGEVVGGGAEGWRGVFRTAVG